MSLPKQLEVTSIWPATQNLIKGNRGGVPGLGPEFASKTMSFVFLLGVGIVATLINTQHVALKVISVTLGGVE